MRRTGLIVLGFLAAASGQARTWQEGLALSYSDGTTTMPYRLYLPYAYSSATNYPLVLFLHGAGEVGTNNSSQVSVHIGGLIERTYSNYPAILVAPQMNTTYWWSPANSADLTLGILAYVRRNYGVDDRRLYLTGLSMGGFGATEYAYYFPSVFAAIAPMSGARTIPPSAGTRLSQVPTWLFHGSKDSTVTNLYSRNYFLNITGLGTITFSTTAYGYPTAVADTIRYTELTNLGHDIWNLIFANASPALYDWMFAQVRPPATFTWTALTRSGETFVVRGSNDVPFATGYLLSSTNLAAPASEWLCVGTNWFDAGGRISLTNAPGDETRRFYLLKIP